jgi:hypothetical protein
MDHFDPVSVRLGIWIGGPEICGALSAINHAVLAVGWMWR